MNDIYKSPESEVRLDYYGNINLFKRLSAWYTIIFIILTFGLYIPYWLHTRTKILNQIVRHQTSAYFANTAAFLYVASYVLMTAEIISEDFPISQVAMQYFTYLPILDWAANILIIVWVFKFRNRLQETFSSLDINIGIIMTFFFQIVYLQFKINQIIDQQHNKGVQTEAETPLR